MVADLPPYLHPELRAIVEKYLGRGYTLKDSTAGTATMEAKPGWQDIFLFFGHMAVDIVSGSAPSSPDRREVRLYVDEDGHVYRRAGWMALVLGRRRRKP